MKKIVQTKHAPAPIGPYNQAILSGGTLYASGQIALNPETGAFITENIQAETHQVMRNIKAVLEAVDMDFSDILKASIFIKDMNQFGEINAVYGEYFTSDYAPARETVEVARLPKDANIEISIIAEK
jgi:2-iminobutanoate/2-iminopropanoate deaminase